jgi:hypothetical protein
MLGKRALLRHMGCCYPSTAATCAASKEPAAGTSHAAPDEMNYANGGIDKGASDGVGVVALASASTRRRAAVAGLRAIAQLQSAPGAAAPALLSRRLAN